jgi:hypothetical protein
MKAPNAFDHEKRRNQHGTCSNLNLRGRWPRYPIDISGQEFNFVRSIRVFDVHPPTHSDLIRPGIPGYPPTPYWPVLHCCEALVMRGTLSFFLNDGTPYEESTDAEDTRGLAASCERYVDEGIGFQFICGPHNLAGISEPCQSSWSGLAAS